jgi:DNA-binding LacI/PurR family transcriptional regulator
MPKLHACNFGKLLQLNSEVVYNPSTSRFERCSPGEVKKLSMTTKQTLPAMTPHREAPTPQRQTKHSELTGLLRALVTTLQPGDRLPAQDELMRRYKVSDRTVLRSLEDLQRAGWIVRRPGSGTYVTDPRDRRGDAPDANVVPQTRSRTIAALAPHFFAASYLRLCADTLSARAERANLSLVCHANPIDDLQFIEALQPLGFVLFSYPMASLAEQLIARGHRAVVVGSPPMGIDPTVPCVFADHEIGGHLAAQHLLGLGHRNVAFAFDSQMRYPHPEHPRWRGHQQALQEVRNTGERVSDTVIDAEMLAAWREDASLAAAYFRRPDAPTGVAVWNDGAAIVLLGILHRGGLRVPEDISVIGFDALPEGADSIPPLTTVDQHVDWQMQTVVRLLTRATPPPAQAVTAIPKLIVRSSCGPPPR